MRRGILISIGAISLIAAIALANHSEARTQEVPYQVKQSDRSFEVREYGPRIVAEVEATGSREKALSEAFNTLAGFLFGKNSPQSHVELHKSVVSPKEKLSMTVPVTTQSIGPSTIRMRFFMPTTYLMENLPVPDDKRIKVFELPSQRFAVLRFSGSARKDNFDRHWETLKKILDRKGLTPTGEPFEAYYNPPFTPIFLKRNEVCVPL